MRRRFFLLSLSFLLFFLKSQLQIKAYSLGLGKNKNLSLPLHSSVQAYICMYSYKYMHKNIICYLSGNYFYSITKRQTFFSIKRKIQNCYSLCRELLHIVILQDCNSQLCSGPQQTLCIPSFLKVNLNVSTMMPNFQSSPEGHFCSSEFFIMCDN